VFAVVEVIAFATWMVVGRADWFYIDEWDFLAARKAGNLGDLFRSHNGHWTTLPVLTFRLLYALFGLRVYLPYRVVVLVLYLTAAALLLVVMRRAGVQPWIATAAASLFALFGAGWENIILPFQITFTGSLVFGLVFLLLVDHDGPLDRRDGLGALAGLLALLCSGVGVVMVAVAGIAVILRRGWQPALRLVVPLAVAYGVWLLAIGRTDNAIGSFDAGEMVRFVLTGWRATFGALGPVAAFGIVLALLLAGGFGLAWAQRRATGRTTDLAVPAALLAGSLVLLVITAVNRSAFGVDWARQSRYVSLVGAMTLPALAVAADALATRWRWFLPVAVALFLVGIPANLHAATRAQRALKARDAATRATMLSLAFDPLSRSVPRSVRPEPTTAGEVTIGWLLDAAAHHRLPAAGSPTPRLLASDAFRLSFLETSGRPPTTNCRDARRGLVLDLRKGDRIGISGDAVFLEPSSRVLVGLPLLFKPASDAYVSVLRGPLRVRLRPVTRGGAPRICVGGG
jgi:hypothetical protein